MKITSNFVIVDQTYMSRCFAVCCWQVQHSMTYFAHTFHNQYNYNLVPVFFGLLGSRDCVSFLSELRISTRNCIQHNHNYLNNIKLEI